MPLTDPVPSSSFDVLERNIQDTDKFVNQETGTFTNRVGKQIKPISVIESEANAAVILLGWHQVGLFADGFTYTLQNDIAKDAAGDWHRWNGSLPKVVSAGTLPSSDTNFVKIDYKSHADLTDRNPADGSAHNAADILSNGVTLSNDIASIKSSISTANSDILKNSSDILDLESLISSNSSDIDTINSVLSAIDGEINALTLGQGSNVYGYATLAILNADLTPDDQSIAYVTNDTTATNNGTYRKSGATGSGLWVQSSTDLASLAYQLANDADEAITANDLSELREKVDGSLVRTAQLINTFTLVKGFFTNWTNGTLQANPIFDASDFIAVKPSTTYQMLECHYYTFYDINKVFISGSNTQVSSVVTPANAAYIRVSILKALTASAMLAESGVPVPVERFGSYAQGIYNVNDSNVEDNGLTVNSVDFIALSDNLINEDDLLDGYYMGANGVLVANAGFAVTAPIPVSLGKTYYFSSNNGSYRFTTALNSAGQAQTAQGNNTEGQTEYTVVSADVVYIRITITKPDSYIMMSEQQGADYAPYGNLLDSSIKITPYSIKFFNNIEKTSNLLTLTDAQHGFAGKDGAFVANDGFRLTQRIYVTEGDTYTYSDNIGGMMRFITAYDGNNAVVLSAGSDTNVQSFTVPAGVVYYRVTVVFDGRGDFMLANTVTTPEYEPYGYLVDSDVTVRGNSSGNVSTYRGSKMVTFGDSITAQNMWQPHIVEQLGVASFVRGVSGAPLSGNNVNAFWQDSRIETIDDDLDILVIMGGTNDWAQNRPLGLPDSTDTNEFYGGFNVMMDKIMARFSDARDPSDTMPVVTKKEVRIIINATPYGELPAYVGTNGNAAVNGIGLTTNDYAEACRVMSVKWNTALCDVPVLCGWNTYNITKFMKQDGGFLHVNALGGARLGAAVVGVLNSVPKLA